VIDSRGWNMTELAQAAGVEVSTASGWLHGTVPRRRALLALCQKLGVSEHDLCPPALPSRAPPPVVVPDPVDVIAWPELPAFYDAALRQMIDTLERIRDGAEPLSRLEYVHGMLDVLHPMPQQQRKP
jgi:transcriptional regulator with XRE-family HTH domain